MTRHVETLQDAVEEALRGQSTMTKCQAHEDGTASVHVSPGDTQPVVIFDHGGCTTEEVLRAADLDMEAILAERDPQEGVQVDGEWTPAGPASHVYQYVTADGVEAFQVLRIPLPGGKKTFRQRHMGPGGRWVWNMDGVERILYRLPEVLAAKRDGKTIYVVEGEKDVEALASRGHVATTSPMGAGKWLDSYTQVLAEASVVIISDADGPGRSHARTVHAALLEAGCQVSVKEAAHGLKDVADHLAAGYGVDDLVETIPEEEERHASYGVDVLDAVERSMEEVKYVIPNVLAQGDRLLLTGLEGSGKSMLLRQLGVQVAAGIHPWDLSDIEPKRVLVIDAENHPNQTLESWQHLVGLCARHDRPIQRGQLTILEEWENEVDLLVPSGHAWLLERVRAYQPDLVVMGPLTNMSGRDLKDDETVRKVKAAVNEARSICGTAFIMEHHAPHRSPMDRERSLRPYGSSMFLKWPDFGFGLKPTEQEGAYEFQRLRSPRVRSRWFPDALRNGRPGSLDFPWMSAVVHPESGAII